MAYCAKKISAASTMGASSTRRQKRTSGRRRCSGNSVKALLRNSSRWLKRSCDSSLHHWGTLKFGEITAPQNRIEYSKPPRCLSCNLKLPSLTPRNVCSIGHQTSKVILTFMNNLPSFKDRRWVVDLIQDFPLACSRLYLDRHSYFSTGNPRGLATFSFFATHQ